MNQGDTGASSARLRRPRPGYEPSLRFRHAAALGLSMLAIAGACSSGHGYAPTAGRALPSTIPTTTTTVPNNVSLRRYVVMKSCTAVSGGWSARGTASNPTAKTTSYAITIYFVTNPGDTVEDSGVTKVTIGSGQTEPWEVTAKFTPTASMQCVLRGVA